MATRILKIVLFLFAIQSLTFSQEKNRDERDAEIVARQFAQRLEQTKDISLLLPKFFRSDFAKYVKECKLVSEGYMEPKLGAKINLKLSKIYFTEFFNFVYLLGKWSLSNYRLSDSADRKIKEMIPTDIFRIMLSNPTLSTIANDEIETGKIIIDGVSQIQEINNKLHLINQKFQRRIKILSRNRLTYRDNIKEIETGIGPFFDGVITDKCDTEPCEYGLAIGSSTIETIIPPGFLVILSRIGRKIKIVDVTFASQ